MPPTPELQAVAIPVQTPAPPVIPAVVVPTPQQQTDPPAVIDVNDVVPQVIFDSVPGLADLSTNIGVIATNIFLSLLVLLCLLVATAIFNGTIKENQESFAAITGTVAAPMAGLASAGRIFDLPESWGALATVFKMSLLLLATSAIYLALDPGFTFDTTGAMLFISLSISLAATTFLYEGAQVLVSTKRYGISAELKIFPIALLIAAASVLLSRVTGFHPGVIFGFVGAAAVAATGDARRQGLVVWLPLVGLFVVSVLALAIISPLRDWSDGQNSEWAKLPETVAVAIFVGGAQSIIFTLLPFAFNDGERVWKWSRTAWFALAIPACFLFFHSIVNGDTSLIDLSAGAHLIIGAAVGILAFAVAVWLFFKVRAARLSSL